MKQLGNVKKFSFAEMTSSSNGKTSISGVAGFLCIIVGLTAFMLSLWIGIEYVYASLSLIGIGAALLGYKKKISKDIASIISSSRGENDDDGEDSTIIPEKNNKPELPQVPHYDDVVDP